MSTTRFQDVSSESDSDDETKNLKAVSCIGLQPGSNVFVLGPSIQYYSNGKSVPQDEQEYKFIPFILAQLGVLQISAPIHNLPEIEAPLHQAVKGIQRVGGENAMCGVFSLGKFEIYNNVICMIIGYLQVYTYERL